MKLQDIADMKDYLENRCYCPYEIYELNGFFFQCFKPETECTLLTEGTRKEFHGKFVIAKAREAYDDAIIYIELTDDKVDDCILFDATENNKQQIVDFMDGKLEKMYLNTYPDEHSIDTILKQCDAVMRGMEG